jgi:hypothetical protein
MFHLFLIERPFRYRASFDTPVRQAHRLLRMSGILIQRNHIPLWLVIASEAKHSRAAGEAGWIASSLRSSQ